MAIACIIFITFDSLILPMPSPTKKRHHTKQDLELAEEINRHIRDIRESDVLIVVEGTKDKNALLSLGIANVFALNKMPLYKVVEIVAKKGKECMILTDLDSEGKKLYGTLNSGLSHHGVRVDNTFREFLFKETQLRQIEGLSRYIGRLGNREEL